jgi:nucleotide-binding universal stress UspA family protein
MKYLVAVDGSEHARKAMDLACTLARGREEDEVVLLTVVDEYSASDILDEDIILAAGITLLPSAATRDANNTFVFSVGEVITKANAELTENAKIVMKISTEHCEKHGVRFSPPQIDSFTYKLEPDLCTRNSGAGQLPGRHRRNRPEGESRRCRCRLARYCLFPRRARFLPIYQSIFLGLGTLSRLLLGSVSDYVVKHSPCPVLVARWEEADHNKQA